MNGLIDRNLNEDTYEEYIDKIVNIFRLSSKSSSILFDLKIEDYKALIKLSIISQTGEKEEFTDVILKCDDVFYKKFLIPLVKKVDDNGDITVKDILDMSDNSLVIFRMITKNNDMFSIVGLSEDDAKSLLNVINKNEEKEIDKLIPDSTGSGNYMFFLFMIGLLAIAFITIIGLID